jgi:hypothetical protein
MKLFVVIAKLFVVIARLVAITKLFVVIAKLVTVTKLFLAIAKLYGKVVRKKLNDWQNIDFCMQMQTLWSALRLGDPLQPTTDGEAAKYAGNPLTDYQTPHLWTLPAFYRVL